MSHHHPRRRMVGGIVGGPKYPWYGEPADTDIYLSTTGTTLPDADAAIKLYQSDPAKDRKWFRRYRNETIRIRRITTQEQEVLGHPPHTMVCVQMTDSGPLRHYRWRH